MSLLRYDPVQHQYMIPCIEKHAQVKEQRDKEAAVQKYRQRHANNAILQPGFSDLSPPRRGRRCIDPPVQREEEEALHRPSRRQLQDAAPERSSFDLFEAETPGMLPDRRQRGGVKLFESMSAEDERVRAPMRRHSRKNEQSIPDDIWIKPQWQSRKNDESIFRDTGSGLKRRPEWSTEAASDSPLLKMGGLVEGSPVLSRTPAYINTIGYQNGGSEAELEFQHRPSIVPRGGHERRYNILNGKNDDPLASRKRQDSLVFKAPSEHSNLNVVHAQQPAVCRPLHNPLVHDPIRPDVVSPHRAPLHILPGPQQPAEQEARPSSDLGILPGIENPLGREHADFLLRQKRHYDERHERSVAPYIVPANIPPSRHTSQGLYQHDQGVWRASLADRSRVQPRRSPSTPPWLGVPAGVSSRRTSPSGLPVERNYSYAAPRSTGEIFSASLRHHDQFAIL